MSSNISDSALLQKVYEIEQSAKNTARIAQNNYALGLLQPLINGYPLLPFTGASLCPFCLAHIINDIVINRRKNIIEFGAGLSTIMIARLIKKNNLNTTILSIENNEEWAISLTEIIQCEGTNDVAEVKYVPLTACKLAVDGNDWYDVKTLKKYTKGKKYDMAIIDGPTAWQPGKGMARYPAVPFISNQLADDFSIYLDDAIRAGEQKVIKTWEEEYGIKFNIAGKTLAYYYGGTSFYTDLFNY